jgi:hypothetical protein
VGPNIDRLIEDITATLTLFEDSATRRRPMHPSAAALEILGAAFTSNDPEDRRAAHLRSQPWVLQSIVGQGRLPLLSGRVHLNYILAAVAYARRDNYPYYTAGQGWNWTAVLQWLVLRGIHEHRLWPFLSGSFMSELLTKSVWAPGGLISPLQLCVLSERPPQSQDWPTAGIPEFDDIFNAWMRECGTGMFRLFWLRSRAELLETINATAHDDATGRCDVLSSHAARRQLQGEPVWPSELPPAEPLERPTQTRLAYRSFGPDFPCLRLNCLDSSVIEEGAWRGLVRIHPGRTHLELLGPCVGLQLPSLWLPSSVLLLDLEVNEQDRSVLWVRLLLDSHVVDRRPAAAYAGGPVKIFLAERPPNPAPVLQLQFAAQASLPASVGPARVYARLYGLQVWQLNLR